MANRTVEVVFDNIPQTVEEFTSLPQASQTSEFDVAALTVIALSVYPKDKEQSLAMLNVLRGPRPLSEMEKQFIRDRFMDSDYVPRSFFKGATPENDYTVGMRVMVQFDPHYKIQDGSRLYDGLETVISRVRILKYGRGDTTRGRYYELDGAISEYHIPFGFLEENLVPIA